MSSFLSSISNNVTEVITDSPSNVKEIVSILSELPTEHRVEGFKLIHKIFDNILQHPNETKYHKLYTQKLSEKFVKSALWFKLFPPAGFYQDSERTKLIFDTTKLDRLKHINNLLLTFNLIINSLATIRSGDRHRESKIVYSIIDKILSNPDTDIYQRLRTKTLSTKFNNNNWNTWYQLLLDIGFREVNNGKNLLYDKKSISKLRFIKEILSTQIQSEYIHHDDISPDLANQAIASILDNFSNIQKTAHEMQEEKQNLNEWQLTLLLLLKEGFSLTDSLNAISMSTKHDEHIQNVDGDDINICMHRIDHLIRLYYKQFNIEYNWDDQTNSGRFLHHIQDAKLPDDLLSFEHELGDNADPSHCQYVNFDTDNFPFDDRIHYDVNNKRKLIFFILQYCYRFNSIPTMATIINARYCDYSVKYIIPFHSFHFHTEYFRKESRRRIIVPSTNEAIYKDNCTDGVLNCIPLNRFLLEMYRYNNSQADGNKVMDEIDNVLMLQITNDYFHLIQNHNDDHDFEFIHQQQHKCDVIHCNMFKRNNRDRNKCNEQKNDFDSRWSLYCEIMDKMHCYYMHSIDVGYRTSITEKQKIIMDTHVDPESTRNAITKQILTKIGNLISKKREKHKNVLNLFNNNRHRKYNQFGHTDQVDNKQDDKYILKTDDKVYHFGFGFIYGYSGEITEEENDSIYVTAKYVSLKEELICNSIAKINLQQFNNEYQKAQINHSSYVAKWYYEYMSIDCVLAMMIYCNYDVLQYHFSRTYREYDGKQH
eukprot:343248_1